MVGVAGVAEPVRAVGGVGGVASGWRAVRGGGGIRREADGEDRSRAQPPVRRDRAAVPVHHLPYEGQPQPEALADEPANRRSESAGSRPTPSSRTVSSTTSGPPTTVTQMWPPNSCG